MKHYDSIENIKTDASLIGEEVWAFNKLDGQNFCAKFQPKSKNFTGFGSRNRTVDESDLQFGQTVKYFKESKIPEILTKILIDNSKKNKYFNSAEEVTFFFEWYGENSFAGSHQEDDKTKDDYDKPIGGLHNDDGYPSYNDYEPTIRHFQDD